QANRIEIAQGFAETHQLYVVLKGHRSLIATPEGHVFVNPTGNPGMATGGMGDLLTGMVAAWLAQLLDAEAACKLAVYLHGLAGDLTEAEKGEVALTPSDVLARLGDAVAEVMGRRKKEEEGATLVAPPGGTAELKFGPTQASQKSAWRRRRARGALRR